MKAFITGSRASLRPSSKRSKIWVTCERDAAAPQRLDEAKIEYRLISYKGK